ncbi:DNA mismatch repair protein Mlh1 [Nymphon striatum]|nr:DNA mismatch repair protein Mlh1 [Nymphon striatum]
MNTPKKIEKLEEAVVNRIAAGEVIQRPCNAVKELVENSLDAGSTVIQVLLNAGGMKKMTIVDNGCGIRRDDMEIVCERFTTSKLRKFEDLTSISTYGFRGEALASISYVGHLTMTTKTADSNCAFKASYHEGKLKDQVKPCAGNQGTQISIEDLFYNVPVRRKTLQSTSQEHAKVVEMLGKYAIHNSGISFQLQKVGNPSADLKTFPEVSVEENIRIIYGNNVARYSIELVPFSKVKVLIELLKVNAEDDKLKFKMSGLVTNANFSVKKMIFLLFINNRLVDSTAMKKVIDNVYSVYLPKKGFPFIYLSLEISPENIDVNVHPTKHEVHFLHEENILQKISEMIESAMLGSNTSRTFYVQSLLPSTINSSVNESFSSSKKVYDHQLVRTDSKEQKLDAFLQSKKLPVSLESSSCENADKSSEKNEIAMKDDADNDDSIISTPGLNLPSRREVKLSSILQLQKEIKDLSHHGLRQMFRFHKFGACINKEHSLIQYKTGLFLINVPSLSEELFYQLLIYDFANFGIMRLQEPISVTELAVLALNSKESGWTEEHGKKEELALYVVQLLVSKAEMLNDYYSLRIDQKGNLHSLPLLLDNYVPDMSGLPMYILRLATELDWDSEKNCFESLARETARFYQFHKNFIGMSALDNNDGNIKSNEWKWTVEHVLFPAFKSAVQPPKQFADDGSILEIAELSQLYKVFERC